MALAAMLECRAFGDFRQPATNSWRFGAIVVPEPHAKHHNQPHREAIRSLQNRRFCGKFSFLVRPVLVRRIIRTQQVIGLKVLAREPLR